MPRVMVLYAVPLF